MCKSIAHGDGEAENVGAGLVFNAETCGERRAFFDRIYRMNRIVIVGLWNYEIMRL